MSIWLLTWLIFDAKDEGTSFLRKDGELPSDYTAVRPGTPYRAKLVMPLAAAVST
jgi:hypothetical protein